MRRCSDCGMIVAATDDDNWCPRCADKIRDRVTQMFREAHSPEERFQSRQRWVVPVDPGFPVSAYVRGWGCLVGSVVVTGIAWYTLYRTIRWGLSL